MGSVAAILVVAGIIALICSVYLKMKAGRVAKTPLVKSAEAAQQGPGSPVSVEGNVVCAQPLIAPYSQQPCLYCKISITAKWKEGDKHKERELRSDKLAAIFTVDDGSGPVQIDASKGGNFPTTSKNETKGGGLAAAIAGGNITFGTYSVHVGALSVGTSYVVQEEIMKVHPRLYVNGMTAGGAITEPSGLLSQLLISEKSRDDLLAHSLKTSKLCLIGGAAGLVVGIILGVVSNLMSKPDETASPSASASVTASVAAALPAASAEPAAADTAAAKAAEPAAGHAAAGHAVAGGAAAAAAAKPGGASVGVSAGVTAGAAAKPGAAAGAKPAPVAAKPAGAKPGK